MKLRAAKPSDAPLLRRWDEMPHVKAADPNDDWNWEVELARSPEWREQLIRPAGRRTFGQDDCLVHRLERADFR